VTTGQETPAGALREALDALADALASGRLEPLLELDTRLERTLVRLRAQQPQPAGAADVRADLVAARRALARCRRLGDGLSAFIHDSLTPRGTGAGYVPDLRLAAPTGGAIDARA
jgi:hypothetical protein